MKSNTQIEKELEWCKEERERLTKEEPQRIIGFVACIGIAYIVVMVLTDLMTLIP